jgi:hypothetical protein
VGNELFGPLRDRLDLTFQNILFVGGICMLAPLVLLPLIQPTQVARAREEDNDPHAE